MILVFGGTTEGKQVIEVLEALQYPYVYSTKTEIKVNLGEKGTYRFGAFNEEGLTAFIINQKVKLIIHASHPFAQELHQTIHEASTQTKTPVLRLERNYPDPTQHENVHYVDSYNDALTLLQDQYKNKTLLALTGVQSINKLKEHWNETPSYFRILDRKSSIDLALHYQFPKEQLILGLPNKTVTPEIELIKKLKIEIIITKESGDSGSLSVKIESALRTGVSIIIIKKPHLPTSFQLAQNTKELTEFMIHHPSFSTHNSKSWA